jgi:hypothetical protein
MPMADSSATWFAITVFAPPLGLVAYLLDRRYAPLKKEVLGAERTFRVCAQASEGGDLQNTRSPVRFHVREACFHRESARRGSPPGDAYAPTVAGRATGERAS